MRTLVAAALLATSLTGCADPTEPVIDLGDLPATISLGRGEGVTVGGTRVAFTAVLSNSLCPKDVQCVWAGSVEMQFVIGSTTGLGPAAQLVLHSNLEPRSGSAMGLRLTVEELTDAPDNHDLKGRYRVNLRIEASPVES